MKVKFVKVINDGFGCEMKIGMEDKDVIVGLFDSGEILESGEDFDGYGDVLRNFESGVVVGNCDVLDFCIGDDDSCWCDLIKKLMEYEKGLYGDDGMLCKLKDKEELFKNYGRWFGVNDDGDVIES